MRRAPQPDRTPFMSTCRGRRGRNVSDAGASWPISVPRPTGPASVAAASMRLAAPVRRWP